MFSSIKFYIYLVTGVAILSIASWAFYDYNKAIRDLALEKANNQTLSNALTIQKETIANAVNTIDSWQKAQENFNHTITAMQTSNEQADKRVRELKALYAKHDFTQLSRKHPDYVEGVINRGTQQSICLLIITTGGQDRSCTSSTQAAPSKTRLAPSRTNSIPTGKLVGDNTRQSTQD